MLLDYSIGHILVPISDLWWPVWLNGRAFARDPKGRGFESAGPLPVNSLGQAAYVHVFLSPSSINWYRPMGGDALWLGINRRPGGK